MVRGRYRDCLGSNGLAVTPSRCWDKSGEHMDTEECHWIDSCPASDDCPLGWVGDCTNDDLTTNVPTTTDGTTSQTTTTPAQSTTEAITSAVVVSAKEWLPLLISKIETVFEDNRPGKPRAHLVNKWKNLAEDFLKRYQTLSSNGCEFAETYKDKNIKIDFDKVDACMVNFELFRVLANNFSTFFRILIKLYLPLRIGADGSHLIATNTIEEPKQNGLQEKW